MTKFARFGLDDYGNSCIIEIVEGKTLPPFHPDIAKQFRVVPDTVSVWDKDNGDGTYSRYVPPPVPKTYKELRADSYPSVVDQLDALWHAMDDGILPKNNGFYTEIQAVKIKYPKPREVVDESISKSES